MDDRKLPKFVGKMKIRDDDKVFYTLYNYTSINCNSHLNFLFFLAYKGKNHRQDLVRDSGVGQLYEEDRLIDQVQKKRVLNYNFPVSK